MDPRRKKIYIIASVACVVLAVGILAWGQLSTPQVDSTDSTVVVARPTCSSTAASGDYASGFRAPAVFPACDKYNTSVLTTKAFTSLQLYTPVNTDQQLGRPDPFKNY